MAPPFKTVSLDFSFEEGFSKISEIITIAVDKKIINKTSGWYTYQDVKLGQGKIKAKESLETNTFLLEQIKEQIKF